MSRAYIRLDPNLPEHKDSYPDGALSAFVLMLCHAESQPKRGHFRTERIAKALLGRRSRWLSWLIRNGDIIKNDDGTLYVDGWLEWQEGDVTVPERMRRLRERRKRSTVTGVTEPTVYTPSSGGGGGGGTEAGSRNGGSKPKSFMGWKPKPLPGERAVPVHDGRDGPGCLVCFPPEQQS